MKYLIPVFMIFLFLSGCVQQEENVLADSNNIQTYSPDQNASKISPEDMNLFANAHIKKDYADCNKISDSFLQSKCFLDFAIDTNNPMFCNEITFPSLRFNCNQAFLKTKS